MKCAHPHTMRACACSLHGRRGSAPLGGITPPAPRAPARAGGGGGSQVGAPTCPLPKPTLPTSLPQAQCAPPTSHARTHARSLTIGIVGGAGQLGALANLHGGHPLVPPLDHLPHPDREHKRRAAARAGVWGGSEGCCSTGGDASRARCPPPAHPPTRHTKTHQPHSPVTGRVKLAAIGEGAGVVHGHLQYQCVWVCVGGVRGVRRVRGGGGRARSAPADGAIIPVPAQSPPASLSLAPCRRAGARRPRPRR